MGYPGGSEGKEFACNAGNMGSISGLERFLEKGMTTHFSILVQRIPKTEQPGGSYSPRHSKKLVTIEQLTLSLHTFKSILLNCKTTM